MSISNINKSNSAMGLNKRLSKSSLLIPKSLSAHLKEIQEEDHLHKPNRLHKHSSPECKENPDPTGITSVLNALKDSSKKKSMPLRHIIKEMQSDTEVCDFRNVGDLSNFIYTEGNFFIEAPKDEKHLEEEKTQISHKRTSSRKLGLTEEDLNLEQISNEEEQEMISNLGLEILVGRITLEQERLIGTQIKRLQSFEAYLQKLIEIHTMSQQNLARSRFHSQQIKIVELKRLEQMSLAGNEEAEMMAKRHLEDVEKKKEEIEREVQAAFAEEEKRELIMQSLIGSLKEPLDSFRSNLGSLQEEARNIEEGTELQKILFQELPSILNTNQESYGQMTPNLTSEEDVKTTSRRLEDALIILRDIRNLMEKNRQLDSKDVAVKTAVPPYIAVTPLNSQSSIKSETEEPLSVTTEEVKEDAQGISTSLSTSSICAPHKETEKVYQTLKGAYNAIVAQAQETKDNSSLRPILARAVGVVNTFHNEPHDSSNKGKLQQLLNLLQGRPCSVGSETVSTGNNPSAQAFVREQVSSKLVALGHDKQVASMTIYASLIVRLWQLVPQVGELILYKMYDTCPFLVPLGVRREQGQSEEEFHRSLGFRHKEGGSREPVDQYLTRMGAMARLYARIVSMQVDDHPHGIQEGWKWLARTLRSPPYPSVTPALLHGFLTVAGAPLINTYKGQFRKLMMLLSTSYLSQMEQDVLEGGHSDLAALKNLVKEYEHRGSIAVVQEGYKLLL